MSVFSFPRSFIIASFYARCPPKEGLVPKEVKKWKSVSTVCLLHTQLPIKKALKRSVAKR